MVERRCVLEAYRSETLARICEIAAQLPLYLHLA